MGQQVLVLVAFELESLLAAGVGAQIGPSVGQLVREARLVSRN